MFYLVFVVGFVLCFIGLFLNAIAPFFSQISFILPAQLIITLGMLSIIYNTVISKTTGFDRLLPGEYKVLYVERFNCKYNFLISYSGWLKIVSATRELIVPTSREFYPESYYQNDREVKLQFETISSIMKWFDDEKLWVRTDYFYETKN